MAIYVFSLLVGYYLGGVDYAQGTRFPYLKKLSAPVKYVYTDVPRNREISEYRRLGIDAKDMLSAHFWMCGNGSIGGETINNEPYHCKGALAAQDFFTDRLLYTDYYSCAENGSVLTTKPVRRAFRKTDGTSAYDVVYDAQGEERYLFPNGDDLSKPEFLCRFIQSLDLTEKDIILIDRPGKMEFVQPLFMYGNGAKTIVFLHSGHYARKGESDHYLYLNYEYYYWFKNVDKIHSFIVSTEWQKKELIEKLEEYDCTVPNISVIPACGIKEINYPSEDRHAHSLLSVSRLVTGKRIDWVIRSVIAAHRDNNALHLDIYGEGDKKYVDELKHIVAENGAEDYIRFMGHQDVTEVYKEYEAYISASLWETLGLSLMEAAGSGNAMLGLNVKYGNKVFIQDGQNGYTADIDFGRINDEAYVEKVIHNMAQNIVRLFEEPERLKLFQEKSYQIAEQYLNRVVEEKWLSFFEKIMDE